MTSLYAIALGSNRPHGRHGMPRDVVAAAIGRLEESGLQVKARSSTRTTPAMGPAGRAFANAAVVVASDLDPPALLALLKRTEHAFGRRRGRRWGPRVLDLDIILWSGGAWRTPGLIVPHPEFRIRRFVLDPLNEAAPDWRDPITGLTVRQILARLRAPRLVDRSAPGS